MADDLKYSVPGAWYNPDPSLSSGRPTPTPPGAGNPARTDFPTLAQALLQARAARAADPNLQAGAFDAARYGQLQPIVVPGATPVAKTNTDSKLAGILDPANVAGMGGNKKLLPIATPIGPLASVFCYAAGTVIHYADGTKRAIERIHIGDELALGGKVIGVGKVLQPEIFHYKETLVSGGHAVFENGKWIRVRDSQTAELAPDDTQLLVYPIVTENHLLMTDTHISADFAEVDDGYSMNDVQRLEALNSDSAKIADLNAASQEAYGDAA